MKTMRKQVFTFAALAIAPFALAAEPTYDFSGVDAQIDALVQREALPGAGLRVTRRGAIIHEYYLGGYDATTRLPIASASKWLSALAVQRLVEKGKLHWSDTISQYFPDAPAATRAITLGQLFSHTSGITTNDAPCLGDRSTTLDTCARQILALPLLYAPGTSFAYTGNAMQVGGRIAEIASGKSWQQLFADEMTTPLGLQDTSFLTLSASPPTAGSANPQIAGGVASNVRDYANVVQMVAQRGAWQGSPFLSGAGLTQMQVDQTHGVPVLYTPDPSALGYGYGEWRNLADANANAVQISSTGKFGTSPWVDNETGVSAVFLVDSSYSRIANDLRQLWANVRSAVQSADARVNTVDPDQLGLSGAWYDPSTGGQGLIVAVYPDMYGAGRGMLFAGWYTFAGDGSGGQRWYVLQGAANQGSPAMTFDIVTATGGSFAALPAPAAAKVGSATLAFRDCAHGTLTYSFIDGSARIGAIELARLGPAPQACVQP